MSEKIFCFKNTTYKKIVILFFYKLNLIFNFIRKIYYYIFIIIFNLILKVSGPGYNKGIAVKNLSCL